MRRLTLFVVAGVGVVVGAGFMRPSTARAQANKNMSLRLSVVGIGVKDYPKSENFYEKIMGFPVAFKFSSPDGKRTTTYYQMSRDTFLEMQPVTADALPGSRTFIWYRRPDRHHRPASQVCRQRRAPRRPQYHHQPGVAQPSNVKNATFSTTAFDWN
jgi:catechol 2,3-dioxygenase-like lactoylglutathione lyase family enzyme